MMSKRALIAFSLSLLVIIGYNHLMSKKYPAPLRETVTEQQLPYSPQYGESNMFDDAISQQEIMANTAAQSSQGLLRPASPLARSSRNDEKDFVVETDLVKLVITSSGARIKSCQLKEYPEEKISAVSIRKQLNGIELNIGRASGEAKEFLLRQRNKLEALLGKMQEQPEMAELVSLAATIGADFSPAIVLSDDVALNTAASTVGTVDVAAPTARYQCSQDFLALSENRPFGRMEFIYTDSQGRKIKKIYSFSNSNYSIELEIVFSGWDRADLSAGSFLLFNGPDIGMPQAQRGRRTYGYEGPVSCFQNGRQSWVQKEKYGRDEKNIFIRREHKGKGEILWTGLENKYFLTALIPLQPAQAVIVEKNKFGEQKVALAVPWEGSSSYNFKLYLGPKKEERLKAIGVSLEKSMDYGFFGPIARFIYQALVFFSRWTHNFGWAIVLLCLAVKVVFYPLTHHSFESMQKMQLQMKTIQPEMNALREKLKDNPQKLNKEIMGLYRKRGVNPLASCQSGCLPMLLQMPVFFALYAVLYNSIELRGAPFLGWISDLSAKDPLYILPVLMGISMFIQQKLTGMAATGGAQQEQQAKMMAVLMPVFLTWIFASLPSGVVLYWFVFNIVTALQQLIIKKKQQTVSVTQEA